MVTDDSGGTTFLYELARDRNTTALVGYLKRADNPLVRRRAAELLGDFDDIPQEHRRAEVTDALIRAVQTDDDDSVRARAIDSLYRHGRESLEQLIAALADQNVAETPDWVLAETLVEWLDSDYPEFRLVAATALGEIGDRQAMPALLDTLADPDPRVRARVLRTCGRLGDDHCVPHLQDRLTDDYDRVREAAATALGSIGTERALEALIPAVTASNTESVRRIAVEELGQFDTLKPLVVLVEALEDRSDAVTRAALLSLLQLIVKHPPEQTADVRQTVADQLADRDDELILPPLIDIYRETARTGIRYNAVWFLGRVPTAVRDDVLECLLDGLDSDHESIAEAAADSLRELDDETVANRLRIFLQNGEASEHALSRAEYLVAELTPDPAGEVVTNSVDVTYVREPADYTSRHSEE